METMQKEEKINFYEQVVEARVKAVVEEEEELSKKDQEVSALKERTLRNLEKMIQAAEEGNEELRREYRNEIVTDNLRLVTTVLKKYGYFSPDKFQNGCIGLLKAAETFDIEKDVPFHNYAAFCIETEIRLAFRRANRVFESRNKGFLESLDEPTTLANGDSVDKHEMIEDPYAAEEFDMLIEEASVDELFYRAIIPAIEEYGVRAKDIDMELWRDLEIRYFIELSAEHSQRRRLTFTEMARQLGTTPQNIRIRHQKVLKLIREKCQSVLGIQMYKSPITQRVRFYREDANPPVNYRGKKHRGR